MLVFKLETKTTPKRDQKLEFQTLKVRRAPLPFFHIRTGPRVKLMVSKVSNLETRKKKQETSACQQRSIARSKLEIYFEFL